MKLFRAAEALRQEADPIAAAMDEALETQQSQKDRERFFAEEAGP
jgi:hypothetical protein